MKKVRLKIIIEKGAQEVFTFVTDPRNTPLWIEGIAVETTNEWPPKRGTVYHNQDTSGSWKEFILTEYEPNKSFVLSEKGGSYSVRYTLMPIGTNQTELEYQEEWVGTTDRSLTIAVLQKLKAVLEAWS